MYRQNTIAEEGSPCGCTLADAVRGSNVTTDGRGDGPVGTALPAVLADRIGLTASLKRAG